MEILKESAETALRRIAKEAVEIKRSHAELLICLRSIRDICGGDVQAHFSAELAHKISKAITNAERL